MKLVTVMLKKHRSNCYAINNVKNKSWDTPWAYFLTGIEDEGRLYGTAKNPTRRPVRRRGYEWFIVRCNCTYCGARLAVREDSILLNLPKGNP